MDVGADSPLLIRVNPLQVNCDGVLGVLSGEVTWLDMGHWTPIPSTTLLTILDLVTEKNRFLLTESVVGYQWQARKVARLVPSKEIGELLSCWQPTLPDILIHR